jgi:hypothetical protein
VRRGDVLRYGSDLIAKLRQRAIDIVDVFQNKEASPVSTIQHAEARKLLPIISSAAATHRLLTYRTAAELLGRDPHKNSRMVAQVCDLLDAAAALGGVPLLALVTVRELSGDINRKAWRGSVVRGSSSGNN